MASSTVYHKFLETFACAHVSDGFMEEDGNRMLDYFMKLQGSPLVEVKELKDKGNSFFKQKCFAKAADCYDDACKLLGLSLGIIGGEDIQSLSDLAVSLNSNLAACALKLDEYQAAIDLCSMILDTFPRNVKALFRRAVAFMELKRFLKAETDLVEALVVEPKNKDVLRELDVVKGHLLLKENGKRVLEVTPTVGMDVNSKKHIHESVCDSDMNIKDSESVIKEVAENHSDVHIKDNESLIVEMDEAQSTCGIDQNTISEKNEQIPTKSVHEFSKKGGGNSRLRISGQAYQKLLQGNKVSYYHKGKLSIITIRILNNEVTKEGGITKVHGKKKKRRRRSKKPKLKMVVMTEDTSSSSDVINMFHDTSLRASSICGESSNSSSICDNFSPSGIQILQENSTVVTPNSCVPICLVNNSANTYFCSQATNDQPFDFSASPKKYKTSLFGKLSSATSTRMLCRYPSRRRVSEIMSFSISKKKNHSQGDKSPRHNVSTVSTSRSISRKFLCPRGVSVSCCRYSSEVELIKKRKEVFAHLASSDRPLKKPLVFDNPTLSLISFSNNVIIKSDSESR